MEFEAASLALEGQKVGNTIAMLLLEHDDILLEMHEQADEERKKSIQTEASQAIRAAQRSLPAVAEATACVPWPEVGDASKSAMLRGVLEPEVAHLPVSSRQEFDESLVAFLNETVLQRESLLDQARQLSAQLEHLAEAECHMMTSFVESNFRNAGVHSQLVALSCGADGLYAPVDSPQHVWASAWLQAPPSEPETLDLLVCADVSGSMRPRMSALRSMLCSIVDHLKPEDRLCAVTFNHEAHVLVDWTSGNCDGKMHLKATFERLSSGGGTRFGPALETTFRQVAGSIGSIAQKASQGHERPLRIVLLSDGESDEPADLLCKQLLRRLSPLGAAFCAVGYSAASDAQLLCRLSQCGRGPFLYANSEEAASGALGRLSAWAEECSGEGFAIFRGLSGCRILEIENSLGVEPLGGEEAECHAVVLGQLLQGQVRTVALKLELPASLGVPVVNLNAPLVECTFLLSRQGKALSSGHCTLLALQVPSLLVEGLAGIPLRVCLAEEFATFTAERQSDLVKGLSDHWHIPQSSVVVETVREGSVIVDARLLVPPSVAGPLLEAFDASAIEKELQSRGFSVRYVMVPGQRTARRVLQWASADAMSDLASNKLGLSASLESVLHLKALANGAVGAADPGTALGVLEDLEAALVRHSVNHKNAQHYSLQLQTSHSLAFPADPTAYATLRSYDTPALRARGAYSDRTETCCGIVQDLVLKNASFNALDIEFSGVSLKGDSFYEVSAVEVLSEETAESQQVRSWKVPGNMSARLHELTLSGLQPSRAYLVSVTAGGDSKRACPARLMCTMREEIQWKNIGLGSADGWQVLQLEWTGQLYSNCWTVSLNEESAFRHSESPGVNVSKATMTANPRWNISASLDPGVYRVDVDDTNAPVGTSLPPPSSPTRGRVRTNQSASCRARCWVCIGRGWDPRAAMAKLAEKYEGISIRQFSDRVLVAELER